MTFRSRDCPPNLRSRDKLVRVCRAINARTGLAALVLAAISGPGLARAQLLPDGPALKYPAAHPRPMALYGRVLSVTRGESQYGGEREAEAGVGATVPVVSVSQGAIPVAIGLGVGVAARFSLDDPRSALISTDWIAGIHAAARIDRWRVALQLYHESSHLGDEYRDRFDAERVDWTREVATLWASREVGPVTAHGQLSYTLIDELALERPAAGLGLDFQAQAGTLLGAKVWPIAAIYLESAGYADWRITASGRFGVELGAGGRSMAVSVVALDGLSTQRQFFGRRSRYIGFEIRFD